MDENINLYRITENGDEFYVSAPTMGEAINRWKKRIDTEYEPDQVELVGNESNYFYYRVICKHD